VRTKKKESPVQGEGRAAALTGGGKGPWGEKGSREHLNGKKTKPLRSGNSNKEGGSVTPQNPDVLKTWKKL